MPLIMYVIALYVSSCLSLDVDECLNIEKHKLAFRFNFFMSKQQHYTLKKKKCKKKRLFKRDCYLLEV